MKILALRVRNLTSLAGEIEVDFEAPPLANAGLFAITGSTGAGKSTLLDALCLALYDRLPRLGHGDDVRSVLRHGTADGFAEVDFVGRDGGRYRARWEVRRARNRADGTLQAQKMALTDLATGAALGGGKRETLDAIADKVGLDYPQFRRSVLLAQNDFDAFLRAKPDERAGLLELMTGTAIYGELSRAAYERCKGEEAALRALDDELKRVNVLADDERAAIEADTAAAEHQAAHLADEVEGLLREIDWYRRDGELAARVAEAETRRAEAEADLMQAQPERERMEQVRRALAAAPLVAEADRLEAETSRLEREGAQAAEALARCNAALAAAGDRRELSRQADEQAEAAFKAAGPLLDRAADLDSRLAEGDARLERCRAAAQQADELALQAQANVELLERQRQGSLTAVTRLEQWLEANAARQMLAEQAERWQDVVAAHGKAAAEAARARRLAAEASTRLRHLAAQAEADQRQLGDLAGRMHAADGTIAGLNAQLDALDLEQMEGRRDGLAALDEVLAGLEGMAAAATALDRRAQELAGRRTTLEARLAQARADRDGLDARLGEMDAMLPEAQRALALAEAAESEQAASLRRRLIDGEPCPVCGAREHAPDQAHSALGTLLAAQRQRVSQLEGERDRARQARAEADAQARAAEENLSFAAADSARLAEEGHALAARWGEAAAEAARLAGQWGIALPVLPDTPAETGLDAVRAEGERQRRELADRLRAARTAEAERRRALHERDALRAEHQRLGARLAQAAQDRATAEAEKRMAAQAADQAAAQMEQAAERLETPLAVLPNWRDLLSTPDALASRIGALAQEWRGTVAELERQRETARALASKGDSAAAALDNARRNADKESRVVADEAKALEQLRQARAQLFDGRPTAQVRSQLNETCRARRAEYQQAQEAWAHAAQARASADSQCRLLAETRAAVAASLAEARVRRDDRLAQGGLDLAGVRAAMALGEGWMAEAEARQAALREAEAAARAVLAERRQAQAAHQAAGRPERPAEDLAEALPERTAERDAARDRLAHLRQRLAEDDRNRAAAEDTRLRIAEQRRRHDLWKGMADLIGSADGKKFRLFAQGLTLDRLVGLANLHLAELTPRYVLRRVPGPDLELAVLDRDMADEVRGVANLSGGERFLVSLSLALGLASMTGSRTLSESLFIDEGFGALDAESLDVAIGALETLHASGRKVGVISHVQAMIDRIGVQVRIAKLGGGRSAVETRAA